MSNQYYQLSTDYDLADKHLKEGATLAAWLWMPNKQLRTFSITDGKLFIDGLNPPSDFTYEKYLVQFLLTVDLPYSTDVDEINEIDRLNHELEIANDLVRLKEEQVEKLQNQYRNQTQAYEAIIKGAQESLKDCFDKNEELEAQNTLANEALTAIAKQLGFESFANEEVMIAVENLLLNPKWEQLAKEWKQSSENSEILCDKIKQENEILLDNLNRSQSDRLSELTNIILLDNLNRSQSDRLSELTNIMRMIQAIEETPQDCYYGALRLIRQVIYSAICKLDPSQSWDA